MSRLSVEIPFGFQDIRDWRPNLSDCRALENWSQTARGLVLTELGGVRYAWKTDAISTR